MLNLPFNHFIALFPLRSMQSLLNTCPQTGILSKENLTHVMWAAQGSAIWSVSKNEIDLLSTQDPRVPQSIIVPEYITPIPQTLVLFVPETVRF